MLLPVVLVALGLLSGPSLQPAARASSACPLGATLNVVAHQDDDLLFLSPDLLRDVRSGRCVRTVFVTAGDGGGGESRWAARESGAQAAYARMAGANNAWAPSSAAIEGHPAPLLTLAGHPEISLVFMRLPDGWLDGTGVAPNAYESLQKLWEGSLTKLHAVDGSSTYTKADVISALRSLMAGLQPDTIRTQDYVGRFGDGDHSDHHAVAYVTREAERAYGTPHTLVGYQDYETEFRPQNVFDPDLTAKKNAFFAYLEYDPAPCGSPPDCGSNGYGKWLGRQYTVSTGATPAGGGGGGSPGPADLRVSISLDAPSAPVGGTLVWRIRVDDVNRAAAVGAWVDIVLPAGIEVTAATTDRGPGCTSGVAGRLHCSLDWLSADAPVGNVLLATRVVVPGELALTAAVGADGGDLVPADNVVTARANVTAVAQPGPLTPPRARAPRPRVVLVPESASCAAGVGGTATIAAMLSVDRSATVTVRIRDRRTGAVVWSKAGSRLAGRRLDAPAASLSTAIAAPRTMRLAARVRRTATGRLCALVVTVFAKGPGGRDRMELRVPVTRADGRKARVPG